jgi:polyhydroxyalkanoate synthesis repressor PhaR
LNVEFLVAAVKDFGKICALQQEAEAMNSTRVVIKKYANRRLYDTSASRYINLEDIAALVRNGKDVQVVDASTGEDLTRVTLTQIIVEDARGQPSGLPLELLRQLIVASDRVGQEFIMWYLNSAFEAYKKVQSSLQSRLSEMQTAALSPLQTMKNLLQNTGGEKGGNSNQELQELRQRLAELEGKKQKSGPSSKPRRTTKPRTRRKRI